MLFVLRQDHRNNSLTIHSNSTAHHSSTTKRSVYEDRWLQKYICSQKPTLTFWLFRKFKQSFPITTTAVAFDSKNMRIAGNKAVAVSWAIFGITTPFLLLRIYLRCRTRNMRWFSEIAVLLAYLFYMGSNICDTEVWKRGLFQPGANYDNHWQETWPGLIHNNGALIEIMKVCYYIYLVLFLESPVYMKANVQFSRLNSPESSSFTPKYGLSSSQYWPFSIVSYLGVW